MAEEENEEDKEVAVEEEKKEVVDGEVDKEEEEDRKEKEEEEDKDEEKAADEEGDKEEEEAEERGGGRRRRGRGLGHCRGCSIISTEIPPPQSNLTLKGEDQRGKGREEGRVARREKRGPREPLFSVAHRERGILK